MHCAKVFVGFIVGQLILVLGNAPQRLKESVHVRKLLWGDND